MTLVLNVSPFKTEPGKGCAPSLALPLAVGLRASARAVPCRGGSSARSVRGPGAGLRDRAHGRTCRSDPGSQGRPVCLCQRGGDRDLQGAFSDAAGSHIQAAGRQPASVRWAGTAEHGVHPRVFRRTGPRASRRNPSQHRGGRERRLSTIPMDALERVEVIRGGGSTVYGSNAMGGVVNLTSKAPEGGPESSALFSYGSWDTLKGAATTRGSVKGVDYLLSGTYLQSDRRLHLRDIRSDSGRPGGPVRAKRRHGSIMTSLPSTSLPAPDSLRGKDSRST